MAKRLPEGVWACVFLLLLFFLLSPWLSTLAFVKFWEITQHVSIAGRWKPVSSPWGGFEIDRLKAEWQNAGRITEGNVRIVFWPLAFPFPGGRLKLKGENLDVEAGERFIQQVSKDKFHVHTFEALVTLQPSREPLVETLVIDSPTIRFQMKGKTDR